MHNRFPLVKKRISSLKESLTKKDRAHKNHNRAELPSGFLVSSTPSSIATGKRVIEHTPMTTKMIKSAAALCGLTAENTRYVNDSKRKESRISLPAQIREHQPIAMIGHKIRTVIPR
jgi:hypothetical protein